MDATDEGIRVPVNGVELRDVVRDRVAARRAPRTVDLVAEIIPTPPTAQIPPRATRLETRA